MKSRLSLPLGRTAAVFIDLQEEHRRDPGFLAEGFDRVIANAASLQRAARASGVPLFHYAYVVDGGARAGGFRPTKADGRPAFSDKDDPNSAICPEVAPLLGERVTTKDRASSFRDDFGPELKKLGVEWIVVCGVWTEACVYETVKDAQALGFRVLVVKDACASGTRAMHEIAVLNLANRLYGGGVATTDAAVALLSHGEAEVWLAMEAVPLRYTAETAARLYADL
ncbi:MAG: isochorismatase family protein [Pseudomonadota bacterium]